MAIEIPKVPKELRAMFALLALLIIIGFVIVMGATIYKNTSNMLGISQTPVTNCTDTDGGNLSMVFGTCTDSSRIQHSDTCVLTGVREPLKLQEWFCSNTTNTCVSVIENCYPNFTCQSGVCVQA